MTLSLRVGMDFPNSAHATDPARLTCYVLGPDGGKTKARVAPKSPGRS